MTGGSNKDVDSDLRPRAGESIAAALRAGRDIGLRVWGTSMLPAIWPGDVVLVSPSGPAPLSKSAIVLFLCNGRLFAHRVVSRGGDRLITRGDALRDCDPPIAASDLLGIVTGILRLRGTGLQTVIQAGPPSFRHRLIALAVRRSEAVYRLVMTWDRLSRGSFPVPKGERPGVRSVRP